jgi:photosystem II stability/assembly factor-like uncharacterized protein
MKVLHKSFLLLIGFALVGQGCIQFGGSGSTAGPDGGLWQTIDSGEIWNQLEALPSASGVGSIGGINVSAMEIDPSDPSALYLGTEGNGMFYSYDSGSTWQRPEDELARNGYVIDVEVDPRDVCTLYLLKSDRILKSVDCSRTYTSVFVETRSDEQLTTLALDWFNPDVVWAGSSAGDVMQSKDAGANWSTVERLKSDVTDILVSNADSRVVLVGTQSKGVYRRSTSGEWIELEDDFDDYKQADKVYSLAQTANGSLTLMNSKYGLFKSRDAGATWEALELVTAPGEVRIWGMTMDPKDSNKIHYATINTLYQSTSGGDAWVTQEMPSARAAKVLQVHPVNTDILYAGFAVEED